ncbi:MAG: hypothetical protein AVDCRST_MAG31-822 [uncultured Sphingomonas sp.]|uniref:Surface-adhesin protein E-like domain-containing protein n=1 Tax=uncultured Sphingomonas sp. TaxID=158754 RepID=A0A6J4SYR6_9SPHN|nr:surface-adhesin E family protein [uncultured Sphingomonas sp.]CAA9508600.1 MAG: hypothetical protein AVDCRST_MAG31-822 [uncultured Sphingomonas sp.]
MKRRPLQFVMAWALSVVTQSDRWVPVGGSHNEYQDHLDQESLKRSGNKVTLWTRRDFVTQQRTAWNEIEVDCARKWDTILAYVQDDAGVISHNVVRPHRGSTAIPPNSVGERIYDLVCR